MYHKMVYLEHKWVLLIKCCLDEANYTLPVMLARLL